jgi:hypothetical protein
MPSLPHVQVDAAGISLGTVNVTNYQVYDAADKATIDAFSVLPQQPALSVETTHGLIRQASPTGVPVLFVSGIANRVYHYKQEATAPHRYLAAFNTGVVVGDLLLALSADTSQW